jgi:CrcB protein
VNWLWVIAGGMLGAPLRYLADRAVQARHGTAFPLGTLAVNTAGSLVLGVVAGAGLSGDARLFLATGVCGGLTTYSTFAWETLRLAEGGSRAAAVAAAAANAAANVAAGLVAVYGGAALGAAVA